MDGSTSQPKAIQFEGVEVSADDATVISKRGSAVLPSLAGSGAADLGKALVGEQLDHFRLEEYIGGGGMGAVFRAVDTVLGRTVAVKVLLRQHGFDEDTTRRFRNEAQSAARLDHPNIARVYYVGEDRDWNYIVLEYVAGGNLRDLVYREGPLSVADAISYTLQMAEALGHASSRDVVHRDIKPSNVLICPDGHAKLVDMGLARLRQVENSQDDLTASGVTLGTFDYISPEQARDPRVADVRSDLYSLGCTLYFMLTSLPPFPDGTVLQKLLRHQGDEPPDPRRIRPDLPEGLCRILKKLLAKSPSRRYQTSKDLAVDLLRLIEELDLATPVAATTAWATAVAPSPSRLQRHLPWMVSAALLIVISMLVHYAGSVPASPTLRMPHPVDPVISVPPRASTEGTNTDRPGALTDRSDTEALRSDTHPSPDLAPTSPASDDELRSDPSPRVVDREPATVGGPTETMPNGFPIPRQPEEAPVPRSDGLASRDVPTLPAEGSPATADGATSPDVVTKILVVDGLGDGHTTFATLQDACKKVATGSVIELRYNGRLRIPDKPIALGDTKVTIRAGEGFDPVVWYRPESPDPLKHARQMIQISGGELALNHIHFELDIPVRVRSDHWSLFESVLADKIRLQDCTLTVRNAAPDGTSRYNEVGFFHVTTGQPFDAPLPVEPAVRDSRLHLELRNCVVRGEATLLRGSALSITRVRWENGLLAISERLVEVEGIARPISQNDGLEIDLRYVTLLVRGGLCGITKHADLRYLPPVEIDCSDCVVATEQAPLIAQMGEESEEVFKKTFHWNAGNNFYEDIDIFWMIDSPRLPALVEMDWKEWQAHWGAGHERQERPLPVKWSRRPASERTLHSYTPSDLALDPIESNPAHGSGSDGLTDAGFQRLLLPQMPPAADADFEAESPEVFSFPE